MAHAIADRAFIDRAVRSSIGTIVVMLVLALGFGVLGAFNVAGLAKDLTATETQTTGEVIDEGSISVLTGSRRNRHYEDRRTITIEYAIGGSTTSGTVQNDELQVGETVTIWVDDATAEIAVAEPTGPGFWNWVWAIVVPLLALAGLWGFVVSVRSTIRLKNFDPIGREPDFLFVLQGIEAKNGEGRRAKKRDFIFHGVTATSSIPAHAGRRVKITAPEKDVPAVQTYPPQMSGYYLIPGKESTQTVLHAPELGDLWWSGVLAPEE